jgi:hypothetical protein
MKKLLLAVAVLMFLPKAHACTVTLSPSTNTLQTNQSESVTASITGSGCGSTTNWALSCSPSGNCGSLTGQSRNGATYNAPTSPPSGTVTVTVKAVNSGSQCSGTGCAVVTIKVPTGLTVTPANSSIYLGNTQTMSATENFSDGSTQPNVSATYTSSNTTVATVSGSTVTSVNFSAIPGPTTIAGSYTDPQTLGAVTGNTSLTVNTAVQINAVFPPPIPSGDLTNDSYDCAQFYPTGSANWSAFINNLIGGGNGSSGKYIWAVNPYVVWNQIEVDSGSTVVEYDFDCFDQYVKNFVSAGKKINLIVKGISDTNNAGADSSTPAYILTDGVDVIDNTSTCYLQDWMAVYEPGYETYYKNFVKAVLQHYSSSCSSASPATPPCSSSNGADGPDLAADIGYIRIGLASGGEAFPSCISWMKTLSSPYTYISEVSPFNTSDPQPKTWLTYVSGMDSYEYGLGSSIQLMGALNQADSASIEYAYPDGEAYYAVQNKQGIGSQGLQYSDLTASPCTSDWCALFNTYHTTAPYLELQTDYYSDPTNNQSDSPDVGSLNNLVPFAIQDHYANVFELYTTDLFLAFDVNDYTSSIPGYNSTYTSYSSSYASTLEAAVSGNQ